MTPQRRSIASDTPPLSDNARRLQEAFVTLASWRCPPMLIYALQRSGLTYREAQPAIDELVERGLLERTGS
jgi:hypothetical protein